MARLLTDSTKPVDVDRVVYATITLMSVLIVYDGWQRLRFLGVVAVIVGPVLAMFLSHIFSASLAQELTLGRPLTMRERMTIARFESRFLLICVPPVLLLGILALLGVSMIDAIRYLLILGTGSLGYWSGRAGRTAGLTGWRLARAVLAGLVIGALILGMYVVLQPGKVVSGGTI
jgi:hypothetical protein